MVRCCGDFEGQLDFLYKKPEEDETEQLDKNKVSELFGKPNLFSPSVYKLTECFELENKDVQNGVYDQKEKTKKICFWVGVGTEIISGAGFGTGCVFGVLVTSGNKFACGFVSSAFNVLKLGGSIGVGLGFLVLVGGGIGLIIYGKSRSNGENRTNSEGSYQHLSVYKSKNTGVK